MSDSATITASIRSTPSLSTGGGELSASVSSSTAASQAGGGTASAVFEASSVSASYTQQSTLAQSWVSGMSQADQPFALAMLALLDLLLGGRDRDKDRDKQGLSALAGLLLQSSLGRSSRSATYISQVSQQVTSVQATAVQAVAYSQSSGSLPTSPAASGQTINTVA